MSGLDVMASHDALNSLARAYLHDKQEEKLLRQLTSWPPCINPCLNPILLQDKVKK